MAQGLWHRRGHPGTMGIAMRGQPGGGDESKAWATRSCRVSVASWSAWGTCCRCPGADAADARGRGAVSARGLRQAHSLAGRLQGLDRSLGGRGAEEPVSPLVGARGRAGEPLAPEGMPDLVASVLAGLRYG